MYMNGLRERPSKQYRHEPGLPHKLRGWQKRDRHPLWKPVCPPRFSFVRRAYLGVSLPRTATTRVFYFVVLSIEHEPYPSLPLAIRLWWLSLEGAQPHFEKAMSSFFFVESVLSSLSRCIPITNNWKWNGGIAEVVIVLYLCWLCRCHGGSEDNQ